MGTGEQGGARVHHDKGTGLTHSLLEKASYLFVTKVGLIIAADMFSDCFAW